MNRQQLILTDSAINPTKLFSLGGKDYQKGFYEIIQKGEDIGDDGLLSLKNVKLGLKSIHSGKTILPPTSVGRFLDKNKVEIGDYAAVMAV